jgi:ammonium transporter
MDSTLIFVCCIVILLMQLGFLALEAGQVRAKNILNVAYKNLFDLAISLLLFWLLGYGVIFGWDEDEALFGQLFVHQLDGPIEPLFFLLQALFCATTATIISGAIAERGSLSGFLLMVALTGGLIYPVAALLVWGQSQIPIASGLYHLGFRDLAGATVVHGVGGAVALAAVIIIGPRLGFDSDSKPKPSQPLFSIAGTVFMWIGWVGFNCGALLLLSSHTYQVAVNTLLAGGAGLICASLLSRRHFGFVHLGWACNGIIAGLVSVTAAADIIHAWQAVIIAVIGSTIAMWGTLWLEKYRIDDVIAVVPTHLFAGIWGTLCVGLFGNLELLQTGLTRPVQVTVQAICSLALVLWAFGCAWLVLSLVNRLWPLRVSQQIELDGLDRHLHGVDARLLDRALSLQYEQADMTAEEAVAAAPKQAPPAPSNTASHETAVSGNHRNLRQAKSEPHDLANLTHPSAAQEQVFNLHASLEHALELCQSAFPSNVHINQELSQQPLWIHACPKQLTQVLINLIHNALDAMPGEGVLRLTSQQQPGSVWLDIIDTGCGIRINDLPRLFDADFTTKPQGKGEGLGLSICRELVERFGGRIAVMSQPDKGSRFRLIFPAAEPPADLTSAALAPWSHSN